MKQIGLFKNENVSVPPRIIQNDHYAIFDGNSYFDTGWWPTVEDNITKIEIEWFALVNGLLTTDRNGYYSLYGIGGSSNIWQMWVGYGGTQINIRHTSASQLYFPTDGYNILAGDKLNLVLERQNGRNYYYFYVNDVLKYSADRQENVYSSGAQMWIGHTYPGDWNERQWKGTYHYAKFYSNDTLVHDYNFKNINGTGKMFDKVNGNVFDNQGTGSIQIIDI